MKYLIFFSVSLILASCSGRENKADGEKHPVVDSTNVRPIGQKLKNDSSSFKEYDTYKFENDSLVQYAYIHYLTAKKIVFRLTSFNKKKDKFCELADTATLTATEAIPDPAAYSDELDGDVLYPAYEFLYDRDGDRHTYIGVEPDRGKRLHVQTALSLLCGPFCPLESVGTLRRVSLSPVKQEGPRLPPIPQ